MVMIIMYATTKRVYNYILGLRDESKTLYEAYQEQYRCNPLGDGTIASGNKLIELMAEQTKERWEEMITSIDLTQNASMFSQH